MERFTEEAVEVGEQALPFVPASYIRTFEAFSEHERHTLDVSTLSLKVSYEKKS